MAGRKLRMTGAIAVRWVPALFLVMVFGIQGWAKFDDTSGWARAFNHWGYPEWFRWLIGVLEVGAAVCLLWGRTAIFGAASIIVVMVGALATKVIQDGGRHMQSEVLPIVLSSLILWLRRDQAFKVIGRRVARTVIPE